MHVKINCRLLQLRVSESTIAGVCLVWAVGCVCISLNAIPTHPKMKSLSGFQDHYRISFIRSWRKLLSYDPKSWRQGVWGNVSVFFKALNHSKFQNKLDIFLPLIGTHALNDSLIMWKFPLQKYQIFQSYLNMISHMILEACSLLEMLCNFVH